MTCLHAGVSSTMDEEQPTFKVVDRRPFNPDGTPRELSPEEKEESERAAAAAKAAVAAETAQPPAGAGTIRGTDGRLGAS